MDNLEAQILDNRRAKDSAYRDLAIKRGRQLVTRLQACQCDSLVDVGARYGDTLLAVREALPEIRIVGVDLVPEFVQEMDEEGLEALVGDAQNLPFQDQAFDASFSSHVLEHCQDPMKALQEMFRVSRRMVQIIVPLEGEKPKNISHHFLCTHPAQWWEIYLQADPERRFLPLSYRVTEIYDLEFLFTRVRR